MTGQLKITGLGYTAKRPRKLLDGKPYEKLWIGTVGTDPFLTKNGSVPETVNFCAAIVAKTLHQSQKVAATLKRNTLDETCRAIWEYFYKHYQYKMDKSGVEELRSPARAWKDRKSGIDCDCFSISVSSFLTSLKIPHFFRIVKMHGKDYFQHIYVVVPIEQGANMNVRNNYYVIDPVVDKYDLEPPGVTFKTDYFMEGMPIQYLNGLHDVGRLGTEFDGLGEGLAGQSDEAFLGDFLGRFKRHLINTRNHIRRNPGKIAHFYQPEKLAGMYDELIGVWDDEAQREAALERLSSVEEEALQPYIQGLGSYLHSSDEELFGIINADLSGFYGLGDLGKRAKKNAAKKAAKKAARQAKKAGKKANRAAKKSARKEKRATKKAARKEKRATRKKTGVFTKIKNVHKKVVALHKKVGKKALTFAKKAGKAIVKYNPLTLAARGGFLVGMKTNFGRLASRAYWGYFTLDEAKNAGVSPEYHARSKKAIEALEKIFVKVLKGKPDVLKKAIITGRAAKKVKSMKGLGEMTGLDYLAEDYMTTDGFGQMEGALRALPGRRKFIFRKGMVNRGAKFNINANRTKRIKIVRPAEAIEPSETASNEGKLNVGIQKLRVQGIDGLGDGGATAAAATITAALTFLATAVASLRKIFKGKNADSELTEDGGEMDAPEDETETDPGFTVKNDGAEEAYNEEVEESGSGDEYGEDGGFSPEGEIKASRKSGGSNSANSYSSSSSSSSSSTSRSMRTASPGSGSEEESEESGGSEGEEGGSASRSVARESGGSSTGGGMGKGAMIGLAAAAAVGLALAMKGSKKNKGVDGVPKAKRKTAKPKRKTSTKKTVKKIKIS